MLLILSIILYTALVKPKPKCVGMLMQTTNNCCINCDRQTCCHTPINWHAVKQRQTDRALYRHTTTLKPRDTHTRKHARTCVRAHTHIHTHSHTHTVLCGMPAKSVKYPTSSDACYTVKSNLTVTFHREKYPSSNIKCAHNDNNLSQVQSQFLSKYKQYV